MAKLYGEIAKSALLTLDKSFSRALGQPLDASEVYYSLEAAQTYAATPAAYVGQKIVVIEDGKVTHYSVDDTAGTLKEVGVRPTGDGKSITVSAEGVVSILGAANADSLTLPRMKEDKSGIEWVPVSQVVEGDGNDNTTYTFTELTKGEGDAEEVYGFVVKTFFNGTEVEGGNIEIAFDVYTKSEADAKFLAKADYTPYDDTALTNRVKAVEDNKADKSTTYTKTEVDSAIDSAKKSILGEDVSEAYDTLKEIQEILEGTSGETIDGLIETVADSKAKIATLNGTVETEGSVAKQIADAVAPLATTEALNGVKETAEAAQTAEEVQTAIGSALEDYSTTDEINNILADYYTADEVDAKGYAIAADVEKDYAKKATTLTGYGITDAYTATQTDEAIAAKIREMTGGESAADVLLALNNYKASNDREVWGDEFVASNTIEGTYTPDYSGESRVDKLANRTLALEEKVGHDVESETSPATGLFLEVDQARAQADKGVEDAAKAAQAVTQLASGQVATNKTNIENLQTLVGTIGDGKTDTLAGKIGALEAHDTAHATEFSTLSGKVDQNILDIAKKANAADVYTKGESDALLLAKADADNVYDKTQVYTKTEADAAVKKVTGEVASDTTLVAMIGKKADQDTTYTKTEVDNIINGLDIADVNKSIEDNANAIATLIGSVEGDNAKSVRDITAEETAKIVAGADEKYDTLKEIADWIKSDTTGAAKMASDINTNKTAIEKLNGNKDTVGSVLYMIDQHKNVQATDTILGLVKSSAAQNKIAVIADGTMEVNSLNVNKLVQTDGEELVLNGGKA